MLILDLRLSCTCLAMFIQAELFSITTCQSSGKETCVGGPHRQLIHIVLESERESDGKQKGWDFTLSRRCNLLHVSIVLKK